jgi:hypothetical protein
METTYASRRTRLASAHPHLARRDRPCRGVPETLQEAKKEIPTAVPSPAAMPILAFFFAATWFVQGAMAAHLPGLLQAAGALSAAAIAAASLVGPAQVGARIVQFGLRKRIETLPVRARSAICR